MARILFACLTASITFTASAQTVPRVEVLFVQPEKYTDVGTPPVSDRMRGQTLEDLKRHLVARATGHIPARQKLFIAISDVDLAGGFEPLRSPQLGRIRIDRDIYPPRITLTFRLSDDGGKTIVEGKRVLSDMNYLGSPRIRSDPLRYEKKLLDDWLDREFPAAPAPG